MRDKPTILLLQLAPTTSNQQHRRARVTGEQSGRLGGAPLLTRASLRTMDLPPGFSMKLNKMSRWSLHGSAVFRCPYSTIPKVSLVLPSTATLSLGRSGNATSETLVNPAQPHAQGMQRLAQCCSVLHTCCNAIERIYLVDDYVCMCIYTLSMSIVMRHKHRRTHTDRYTHARTHSRKHEHIQTWYVCARACMSL
jgi:hypothetical protein